MEDITTRIGSQLTPLRPIFQNPIIVGIVTFLGAQILQTLGQRVQQARNRESQNILEKFKQKNRRTWIR